MCLAVVCVEDGLSQIQSHIATYILLCENIIYMVITSTTKYAYKYVLSTYDYVLLICKESSVRNSLRIC